MKEAKISEIFVSVQGEGLYVGVPQLFIRFYGCNMRCEFCDTNPESYRTFTCDSLMSKILEVKELYHSISLTGGEPLLQSGFIKGLLGNYKRYYKKPFYLETNGTLPRQLSEIIDFIDIIAMDFKLSSSTKRRPFWREHRDFLQIARKKNVFVKAVITGNTLQSDIEKMRDILSEIGNIPVVLQPVTSETESDRPDREKLDCFRDILVEVSDKVVIVPQIHKLCGIR